MKPTRRIASDARYIIASVALVTSMGVFASLGSIRRHIPENVPYQTADIAPPVEDQCRCMAPTVQVETSTTDAVPGVEVTTTTTSDCSCGSVVEDTPRVVVQSTRPDSVTVTTSTRDGDAAAAADSSAGTGTADDKSDSPGK